MSPEMSPLLRQCLDATVRELSDEFRGGVFSSEKVGRHVSAAYERVGELRTVGPDFLPVMLEPAVA